jgi:probable F420-dependent oxidoreductase
MNIGIVFPQTQFNGDAAAVRDYAQSVEGLGFTHVVAYDHVLGANPDRPGGWRGAYTYCDAFLEPFVLFSFMAGVTRSLAFCPGVIILPQRQTALVAKQAATLDVLSGGRLRLGVGLGWNEVEYVALNEDFHTRGRRLEEQVTVLQRLWTEPLVTFEGREHRIDDAGLNPLPIQRPIPLWFGGHADPMLRRAARLADGWMPNHRTPVSAKPDLEKLDQYLADAGRSRAEFGLEARIPFGEGRTGDWQALCAGWAALGGTHFSLNTMGAGFATPAEHLQAARTFAEAMGLAPTR